MNAESQTGRADRAGPARRAGRWSLGWTWLICSAVLLGGGTAFIWGPLWSHWHVSVQAVEPAIVAVHRRQPGDNVLATVAETSMMTDHPLRGDAAVAAAERLLAGELALPHLAAVRVDPNFSPRDLEQGVPVQQLFMASLIVPDLLLRAHEHRPNPAFVAAARRYLLGFVAYEAKLQFSEGFERNSHAVANRASVLARYWRHARHGAASSTSGTDGVSATGDAASDLAVHLHARRLAALLSKPSHFIAGTNHGVMQNVALLQLATAFPALPEAAALRTLALQRLAQQLPWYVAPDGAVLEHAAGYHFHGVVLSGYVIRLLQASKQAVPPDWAAAHERALSFMTALQRPDRSLPLLGNTYRYAWTLPPVLGVDEAKRQVQLQDRARFTKVLPVSGHALWWEPRSATGGATHTLVPWGYFAGHGHRRAQELSLLVWAEGTDWSTHTGYWPGSDPEGVTLATGWAGGNSPHVLGEPADSARRSTLLAQAEYAAGQGASAAQALVSLRFLDLERAATGGAAGGPRVRRQIVQWQGSTWIVLDTYVDASKRPLRVLWTAAPETTRQPIGERQFRFERLGSAVAMNLSIDGSRGVSASPLQGSRDPFGGWVAFDRKAHAAPAVDARLATPEGWMMATLDIGPAGASAPLRATMIRYGTAQDWQISLAAEGRGERVLLTRASDALLVQRGGETARIALAPAEPVQEALAAIEQSRVTLLAAYPRFRTLEPERRRYTAALVGLWFLISLAWLAFAVRRERRLRASA